MKFDNGLEQLSPLLDNIKIAMEIVKSMPSAQYPLDANKVFIEAHGELLQLTFDYIEQCGRVVETAMRLMTANRVQ